MKKRLAHWQSTMIGFALIGAGIWLISKQNEVWGGTLVTAGIGALGYKPKEN